jgi:Domain of unknown function (DUF4190)
MSSFCPGCGTNLSEGERFCGTCGRDTSATSTAPPVDPAVAFGLPPETSGKAIASLICGVFFLILPVAMAAIVFGHLSRSEIRRSAGRLKGNGLAIAGLVLGYLGVVFIAVILAISIPNLMRARKDVRNGARTVAEIDETAPPVKAVRTINMAEIAYAQAHPAAGYTCSLSDLSEVWAIDADLDRGKENGYSFSLQGCAAAKANGPVVKYQIVAYPATAKQNGLRAYCSTESDTIKFAGNGSAEDCLKRGRDLPASEINHR